MKKTMQRREAAKALGITAGQLKELEANGTVVPFRDEQRRVIYTPEVVEHARAGLGLSSHRSRAAKPRAAAPPPVRAAPLPLSVPSSPMESQAEIFSQFAQQTVRVLNSDFYGTGFDAIDVLRHWAQNGAPVELPRAFDEHLFAFAARIGIPAGELLDLAMGGVANADAAEPEIDDAIPIAPEQSGMTWEQPWQAASTPEPLQRFYQPPPAVPAQWSPPQQAWPPRTASGFRASTPTPRGYGLPQTDHRSAGRSSTLQLAREGVEVQQLELERRRLERMAIDEEEERRNRERGQREQQIRIFQQQAFAAAQAQQAAELQREELARQEAERREKLVLEAELRRAQTLREEQLERQREQAELDDRGRAVALAELVRSLPAEMPTAEVNAVRAELDRAFQGRPLNAAIILGKDLVQRAAAPHRTRAEREQRIENLRRQFLTTEGFVFNGLPPEAKAEFTAELEAYLASHTIDASTAIATAFELYDLRNRVVSRFKSR
jgi:hypothetical protein